MYIMDLKVFVIIVTYNAMKWVDRCLGSLRQSEVPCVPVVIDNLSKDETVGYIREHYPEAHLIVNSENRGFGQANNQGIEWAYSHGATHFFLLNQDAWIYPDTLVKLVNVQNKYHLALVSPIHLNGKGDNMDFGFHAVIMADDYENRYLTDISLGKVKDYYIVHRVNAAAWMINRKTIETIGGFDPLFFHYGEDTNYLQRLQYHHQIVAFIPYAFIHHDRKIVGHKKVYNSRVNISFLLNAYADINNSYKKPLSNLKSKFVLHLWMIKRAFNALLKLKFRDFWNIIQGYCSLISKIPQIYYSKSTNKKVKPNWLNLND